VRKQEVRRIETASKPESEKEAARTPPVKRFERKFYILPKNIHFAYTFLRQVCRPDSEYPESLVSSLYFDTADLEQYIRSASGDFKKDKVRIRWYDEDDIQGDTAPVFIELKMREGFASSKQRKRLIAPVKELELSRLGRGIISRTELMETLAEFGHYPELPLRPIIKITYHRYRFNEMLTGTRVSLDYHVRSSMVAPELGHRERELRLPGGIIEVKGASIELPLTLRRMRILDTDWTRFSKYGSCIESHMTDLGTVARLSPPGRILDS